MTQRDYMRKLYQKHNGTEAKIIHDYAQAERAGAVTRGSNNYGLSPEEYASRLLHDGINKSWIKG
jgi:hypothetical protein